jgi:hypothetical protein
MVNLVLCAYGKYNNKLSSFSPDAMVNLVMIAYGEFNHKLWLFSPDLTVSG